MVDALPVHRRDHACERGRCEPGHFYGACRRFSELDSAVDLDATTDEGVSERAGGEARRVLDDVDVATRPGARADGSVSDDRSVALLAESKSRAAAGNGADVGDDLNRGAGGPNPRGQERCRNVRTLVGAFAPI